MATFSTLDTPIKIQALATAQVRATNMAPIILSAIQAVQSTLLSQISDTQSATLPFLTTASIESWVASYLQPLYVQSFINQTLALAVSNNFAVASTTIQL